MLYDYFAGRGHFKISNYVILFVGLRTLEIVFEFWLVVLKSVLSKLFNQWFLYREGDKLLFISTQNDSKVIQSFKFNFL